MRTALMSLLVAIAACGCSGSEPGTTSSREAKPKPKPVELPPNVVVICVDDLAIGDIDLEGPYEYQRTPNLRRLRSLGMSLTGYAASSVCSPSRYALLTGRHYAETGLYDAVGHKVEPALAPVVTDTNAADRKVGRMSPSNRLPMEAVTLAEILKSHGYVTGHFGKWHLGVDLNGERWEPMAQGFDVDFPESHRFAGPPRGYYDWKTTKYQGEDAEKDASTEAALFIRRNAERPFFLNFWTYGVHTPCEPDPVTLPYYQKKSRGAGESMSAEYASMVERLDRSVGRVLDALEAIDAIDRTIVVFTSDGGAAHYQVDSTGVPLTTNAPLRGGKGTPWEGGVRVPLWVAGPGIAAGSSSDAYAQGTDVVPTALDLLGIESGPFEGRSFSKALRGQKFDRGPIFFHFPRYWQVDDATPPCLAMRSGKWKLYKFYYDDADGSDRYALYDLEADPAETTDLASTRSDVIDSLKPKMKDFVERNDVAEPKANRNYRPEEPAAAE